MIARSLLIITVLALASFGLALASVFQLGDPAFEAVLAIFFFIIAAVISVFSLETRRNRGDLFHPCYILLGASFFHFVGPSIYNYRQDFYPTQTLGPYLLAHFVVMLGLFCILAGFFLTPVPKRWSVISSNRFKSPATRLVSMVGVVALLAASLGASLYLIKQEGGLGNYMSRLGLRMELFEGQGFLLSVTLISISAAILSYVQLCITPTLVIRVLFAISLVASGFTAILSGSRANLVVLILILLIIRHRVVKPIKLLTGGIIFVLLIVVVFGYIALIRQKTVQSDLEDSEGARGKLSFVYNTLFGKGTFVELNSVARTLEGVPDDLPYQMGASYLSVLTFPIPRAILPGKLAGTSELYTRVLRPEIWAAGRGDRVTFFGETIINFGILGVVFGSTLLGALARQVYVRCNRQIDNPYHSAFYAYFVLWLMIVIRGDTAIATWSVLRISLPALLLYQIIVRLSGRSTGGQGKLRETQTART
ncbi:MAG: O-antigen polymerase [Chthoniobacterales bacterium]